MITTVLVEMKV